MTQYSEEDEPERECFCRRYTAACHEMGIAPLKYAELLALLEALAERPAVTLH